MAANLMSPTRRAGSVRTPRNNAPAARLQRTAVFVENSADTPGCEGCGLWWTASSPSSDAPPRPQGPTHEFDFSDLLCIFTGQGMDGQGAASGAPPPRAMTYDEAVAQSVAPHSTALHRRLSDMAYSDAGGRDDSSDFLRSLSPPKHGEARRHAAATRDATSARHASTECDVPWDTERSLSYSPKPSLTPLRDVTLNLVDFEPDVHDDSDDEDENDDDYTYSAVDEAFEVGLASSDAVARGGLDDDDDDDDDARSDTAGDAIGDVLHEQQRDDNEESNAAAAAVILEDAVQQLKLQLLELEASQQTRRAAPAARRTDAQAAPPWRAGPKATPKKNGRRPFANAINARAD